METYRFGGVELRARHAAAPKTAAAAFDSALFNCQIDAFPALIGRKNTRRTANHNSLDHYTRGE
jgi:hypothetical protein